MVTDSSGTILTQHRVARISSLAATHSGTPARSMFLAAVRRRSWNNLSRTSAAPALTSPSNSLLHTVLRSSAALICATTVSRAAVISRVPRVRRRRPAGIFAPDTTSRGEYSLDNLAEAAHAHRDVGSCSALSIV